MKRLAGMLLCAAVAFGSVAAPAKEAEMEKKIDALLQKMTLDEKIGQLNQQTGTGYSGAMVNAVKGGAVGSILNEVDPEIVNKLQKEAVENSRLGIPLVFARDVIHGFKTIFPIPLGQAATWNPALVEQGARIAAEEASSVGIRWTFSPMVDVSRDARWGRIAESFGEDTYLSSVLGVAMVKGYQTDDLSQPGTMAACTKHFACYGAAEAGKDYNTTWIPEVLLRDVYLPPFEAAAKAGSATFMCSFNDINGVPSSGNPYLNRTILRDEWGYDGMLVSDWASIQQMIPHGFCTDLKDAALKGALAGVDMDMESYAYVNHLKELVEEGKVKESVIDEMVRNVLRLKFRLGLFENPYVDMATARNFYTDEALAAAVKTVEEGAVLLKNNGVLPFKQVKKIALVGPMADDKHNQAGTWCFDLEKERCVTPLQALTEMYGKDAVVYAPGLKYSRDKNEQGIAEAVEAAKNTDVVVMVAGEEAVLSGEAHSRADISLPGAQTKMIEALKATGKPLVLVIMTGRPMTIAYEASLADAVLYTFHGGTMAGPAIANLLSGKSVPSGKLPVSLPKMVGQEPLYYNHKNTGRPASGIVLIDDIPLEASQTSTGCTSYYLDAGDGPAFPFGYGLSYTTFEYGDVRLSAASMGKDGKIEATCTVKNTGSVAASETVQLYVRDLVGSLVRPVKELKGFEKIYLQSGESRDVKFTLNASDLAFWVSAKEKIVEPGEFDLWIAGDSASGAPVKFTVVE